MRPAVTRTLAILALLGAMGWPSRAQSPVERQPQSVPTGQAAVAGTVVDAATNEPIEGVLVELRPDAEGAHGRTALTDAKGQFVIQDVSPCRCRLVATLAGYLPARYGQTSGDDAGTPILVGTDPAQIDLSLRMRHGGVITGVIIGRNGRPAVGVAVRAFRREFVPKTGAVLTSVADGTSDDRGEYRLWGLAPGAYVIDAATATPPPDDAGHGWARTYYPGVVTLGQAVLVTIGAGEERDGIDVPLVDAPLVTVTGSLVSSTGSPLIDGRVQLVEAGDREFAFLSHLPEATMAKGGEFHMTRVIPGAYTLVASANTSGAEVWGTQPLSVGARGLDGVTVVVQPGARVAGTLAFHGTAPLPLKDGPRLWLMPIGRDTVFVNGGVPFAHALPGEDGDLRFTFESVPPGEYWVEPFNPSSPWAFRDTAEAGRDHTTTVVNVRTDDVSDVVVTFTDHPPLLSLTVTTSDGGAASDSTVILFPTDPAARVPWSPMIQTARPATDGTILVSGLVPGNYFVAAVVDVEPNAWFDAKYLETLAPLSTAVTLREGETSPVAVHPVTPKSR